MDQLHASWLQPEGQGCHTWPDGSVYVGGWHHGLKHGWGTYTWPNGAVYRGEWNRGGLHGYGSFETPSGSSYRGGWRHGLRHGMGMKRYANGDTHEGLWITGRPDGPGRYRWQGGGEYDGDWVRGRMHGRGTLLLRDRRYDGEWLHGRAHGVGVLSFADGTTYVGYWRAGKRHGVGLLRSPWTSGRQCHSTARASGLVLPECPTACDLDDVKGTHSSSGREASTTASSLSGSNASKNKAIPLPVSSDAALLAEPSPHHVPINQMPGSFCLSICRSEDDGLVDRRDLPRETVDSLRGLSKELARTLGRPASRGPRKGSRPGDTVFKGHHSYDLVINLQLGVRHTLSTLALPPSLEAHRFEEKVPVLDEKIVNVAGLVWF